MINIKEDKELSVMNHSCAHLLAQAVKHLYPEAKFWVGPVIAEGFYYDIDLGDKVITEDDLPKIEKEMKKISKDGKRIVREELSKKEALEKFGNDPYKVDLINRMDEEPLDIYEEITIPSKETMPVKEEFVEQIKEEIIEKPIKEEIKEEKKFKTSEFISPIYGRSDQNVNKGISKQDISMDNIIDESFDDEDEFLDSLKGFRKNL